MKKSLQFIILGVLMMVGGIITGYVVLDSIIEHKADDLNNNYYEARNSAIEGNADLKRELKDEFKSEQTTFIIDESTGEVIKLIDKKTMAQRIEKNDDRYEYKIEIDHPDVDGNIGMTISDYPIIAGKKKIADIDVYVKDNQLVISSEDRDIITHIDPIRLP